MRHAADLTDPASLKPALEGADAVFLLLAGEALVPGEHHDGILGAVSRSVAVRRSLAGTRSLAGHFRDTLCHSTRRAQGHLHLTQPPGQDRAAVAHAPVIGVCRAA
jgi:hypothetical protein